MYISYNKYQAWGKIAVSILVFGIMVILIHFIPWAKLDFHFSFTMIFAIILWLLAILFFILMFLQLIFFPRGVEINSDARNLTVHYFMLRPRTIDAHTMLKYTNTKLYSRSTIYPGVLIYLKNGKKYLFDEISIRDYKPVKEFLDSRGVYFGGDEKFNNISYFMAFLRHGL